MASDPAYPPPPPGYPPYPHAYAGPPGWPGLRRGHATSTLVLLTVVAFFGGMILGGGSVGAVWAIWAADTESIGSSFDAASERLPAELPRLQQFVESARELEFGEEVDVEILDDAAFGRALTKPVPGASDDEAGDYAATFEALGLTDDADTFYEAEASMYAAYVTGFYDPYTARLVLRGTDWTPYLEATLVHELVHALQDQHFDLAGLSEQAEDEEAAFVLTALIEGDANRITMDYVDQQPISWQDDYYADHEGMTDWSGPYDSLADTLGWLPYHLGTVAVDELISAGDADVLDEALREPPTTTEQLVDIGGWLGGDDDVQPAVAVGRPVPPPGAEVVDEGTLGALLLELFWLDLDADYYVEPAGFAGWRGDSYVTWHEDDRTCTEVVVLLDDDEAAGALAGELDDWADRTGGGVDVAGGTDEPTVTLASCSP